MASFEQCRIIFNRRTAKEEGSDAERFGSQFTRTKNHRTDPCIQHRARLIDRRPCDLEFTYISHTSGVPGVGLAHLCNVMLWPFIFSNPSRITDRPQPPRSALCINLSRYFSPCIIFLLQHWTPVLYPPLSRPVDQCAPFRSFIRTFASGSHHRATPP